MKKVFIVLLSGVALFASVASGVPIIQDWTDGLGRGGVPNDPGSMYIYGEADRLQNKLKRAHRDHNSHVLQKYGHENVPFLAAWDMTCKELHGFFDQRRSDNLPPLAYFSHESALINTVSIFTDSYRTCKIFALQGQHARVTVANRSRCPIVRCKMPEVDDN